MLTGEIEDSDYEPTEETPTFGVVDDGRKYPAVTARKRQQAGSKRSTLYTISKNGKYAHLYDEFVASVIEPYRERKRERNTGSGYSGVNTPAVVIGGADTKGQARQQRERGFGFPVNTVD